MVKLNLPPCNLNLREENGKIEVFDAIRKRYVRLTPEEWVRQHFIHYLTGGLGYPRSLISCESGLKYNDLQKRTDIVVYDRAGAPFMIVECKAPDVKLSQAAFDQAACYNAAIRARYLAITNGLVHYCCHIDSETGKIEFLNAIPAFR